MAAGFPPGSSVPFRFPAESSDRPAGQSSARKMSIASGSNRPPLSFVSRVRIRRRRRNDGVALLYMRAATLVTVWLIASAGLLAENVALAPYSQTVTQNGTTLTLDVKHVD